MECPKCDGHGALCDGCGQPLSSWRECEACGGSYCQQPMVSAELNPGHAFAGRRLPGPDCFDGHVCKAAPIVAQPTIAVGWVDVVGGPGEP